MDNFLEGSSADLPGLNRIENMWGIENVKLVNQSSIHWRSSQYLSSDTKGIRSHNFEHTYFQKS
jgi:hypothetical protein